MRWPIERNIGFDKSRRRALCLGFYSTTSSNILGAIQIE